MSNTPNDTNTTSSAWYAGLSRYHWFVFIACCLGWGLDCFCQQIFNLMRNPALADLLGNLSPTDPVVALYAGYATSVLLIGWGFGGILFGVMSDKFGRARMMIISILIYAGCTGLCGLATTWWMLFIFLFFNGAAVGGQFASGVTLLSETMPNKARPKALGFLQVFAAFCNVCTGTLALICGILESVGFFAAFPVWRFLFLVGFAPALLAFAIMRHLEEPQAWKDSIAAGGVKKAGSIPDLFRHSRWRRNVILGMCLATCGVIGLWGIGFFSGDLTRMTFRNAKNAEARKDNGIEALDFELIRMLANNPKEFLPIAQKKKLTPQSFIGSAPETNDAGTLYQMFVENDNHDAETVLVALDSPSQDGRRKAQKPEEKERRREILAKAPLQEDSTKFEELVTAVSARATSINSYVTRWGSVALILFNIGAVIGTWVITLAAERWGRRIAFTMFFAASFFMTLIVFLTMSTPLHVLIMQPLLGFCILSIFGGYAIYFPELFPTRLRSTAISFCYNIARFAAATGPAGLGLLTLFYRSYDVAEPIRYAGATMAITFILGILFTWLGPETKGKPLPEE